MFRFWRGGGWAPEMVFYAGSKVLLTFWVPTPI
jgi:hypothetical protein